jgi:hypothetical protein
MINQISSSTTAVLSCLLFFVTLILLCSPFSLRYRHMRYHFPLLVYVFLFLLTFSHADFWLLLRYLSVLFSSYLSVASLLRYLSVSNEKSGFRCFYFPPLFCHLRLCSFFPSCFHLFFPLFSCYLRPCVPSSHLVFCFYFSSHILLLETLCSFFPSPFRFFFPLRSCYSRPFVTSSCLIFLFSFFL